MKDVENQKINGCAAEAGNKLDRRQALLKVVRATAYVVPTAAVLLAMSKDAEAGVVVSVA